MDKRKTTIEQFYTKPIKIKNLIGYSELIRQFNGCGTKVIDIPKDTKINVLEVMMNGRIDQKRGVLWVQEDLQLLLKTVG